jgi:HSP20 family protein
MSSRMFDEFFQVSRGYNLYEDGEGGYAIEIEVPGSGKDDISVDVKAGVLTIEAKSSKGRRDRKYSKSFTLDGKFDTEKIAAEIADGLLTVTVPVVKSEKTKKIAIKAA